MRLAQGIGPVHHQADHLEEVPVRCLGHRVLDFVGIGHRDLSACELPPDWAAEHPEVVAAQQDQDVGCIQPLAVDQALDQRGDATSLTLVAREREERRITLRGPVGRRGSRHLDWATAFRAWPGRFVER